MPLLPIPDYAPSLLLRNGHLHTIYGGKLRRVNGLTYARERIETPDEDFLDLDWSKGGAKRVAVLSHGLEGDTGRCYMRGMAKALNRHGWDVLAWNYRGCSGEPNRRLCSYHSGATEDLETVVQHALDTHGYEQVALIGFSLGGNLTLKYVGERGETLDPRVSHAVGFSVPCDLAAGSVQLARPVNWLYMQYFLRSLHQKIQQKMVLFPGEIDDEGFGEIKDFQGFDDRYTAPIHGFKDADDYWTQCSCKSYLPHIRIPTLLINAEDDPYLPVACYPVEEARANPYVHLEIPRYGGHVAFAAFNEAGTYWSEARAAAFLSS